MRKTIKFALVFLVLLFLISACNSGSTQGETANTSNNAAPTSEDLSMEVPPEETKPTPQQYEVVLMDNPDDSALTDVYIKNIDTGDMEFFITLADVDRNHYHSAEYNNGSLFIILEIGYDGYPDEDWTNELWKYSETGEGVKVYSSQGIDFRVSPDGNMIALDIQDDLIFIDPSGILLQGVPFPILFPEAEREIISLEKWADDSSSLWVCTKAGPSPLFFAKVDTGTWGTTTYNILHLPIGNEYDLNPNTGKLVFSDHPVFFDVDSAAAFEESGTPVKLFWYVFATQEQVEIASSAAKHFDPIWLDDVTIEYTNPGGEDRITFTLP